MKTNAGTHSKTLEGWGILRSKWDITTKSLSLPSEFREPCGKGDRKIARARELKNTRGTWSARTMEQSSYDLSETE